ncbi:MAG: hypothetical protein V3U65_14150 [Granulosicoccaceae bacterium]
MKYKIPTDDKLTSMLQMIAGEDAAAKSNDKNKLDSISHRGLFVDKDGELVAICSCDLPTAAALGCALSMIPPGGAESMVEDKELTKSAADNLYEVMNILSSLLMSDHSAHLKISSVVEGSGDDPTSGECHYAGFDLDLGKYGAGSLLFCAV